ncbi:class I lanthipeptide [Chitinophaga nivalis]|uniref:Class I lanthipeptide n=1 Tax=Chitinophaga nivalis TaxID=2991709 RepID=A0ABT3IL98_9BACT|nr:class I lanthipeptide [Chitinophaga nivalis]MCW3465564.1 class I lanthipeptide [Chitinophaga nivalis]MCW3484745.1 class I lanthipeptide [Chitinophaga nivalis]
MKKKVITLEKKLFLSKTAIAALQVAEQQAVQGGVTIMICTTDGTRRPTACTAGGPGEPCC